MSRLRLREVRLSGFKTFADKTTIAFTPGITAIVGAKRQWQVEYRGCTALGTR